MPRRGSQTSAFLLAVLLVGACVSAITALPDDAPAASLNLLWTENSAYGIYTSSAMLHGVYGGHELPMVLSGVTLNPPFAASLRPATQNDTNFAWDVDESDSAYVAAACPGKNAPCRIAVASTGGVDGVTTVMGMARWDATPYTWKVTYGNKTLPVNVDVNNPIVMSADASTVATVFIDSETNNNVHFIWYDAATGRPVLERNLTATTALNAGLSANGERGFALLRPSVYIFSRHGDVLLTAPNDIFVHASCMSPDGNYFAYGWESVQLFEYDATQRQFKLGATLAPDSFGILGACTFSPDSKSLIVGWESYPVNQNVIQVYSLSLTAAPKLIWEYKYKQLQDPGHLEDAPWDIEAIQRRGSDELLFAVGSWGDSVRTNPQVQLFSIKSTQPLAVATTIGSVFDVGIIEDPRDSNNIIVCAGTKHVHANVMGNGGDLYAYSYKLAAPQPAPASSRLLHQHLDDHL